jgi:hypothetical protein
MSDEAFLRQFEDCTFPVEQFHHREHIKVAYLYLRTHSLDGAVTKVREGIKRYNACHKVPEAIDRGYHETITLAWIRLVHFTMCEYGVVESADAFFEQHPELSQTKTLRLFYSRDQIMSAEAKAAFVPPDLTNFPVTKSSQFTTPNSPG